jgi:hypothetical protein
MAARSAHGNDHPVTAPQVGYTWADRLDHTCALVTEDHRQVFGHLGWSAVDNVNVGPAYARGGHADHHLPGSRLADGHLLELR